MDQRVDISFDCLPLRSVGRLDIPLDASPAYRARCERVLHALRQHGSHNSYYLYNASCAYHLTNDDEVGMLQFVFEGTVLTDETDQKTAGCHLEVQLQRETCDWLTEPIVDWFKETVARSVAVEFDRYIACGDLGKTVERIARLHAENERLGGFVGMYI